ncbi:MAG TPA: glycosyltransferase family A protein [Sphingobacterium sp.]|nr:glycosyltransferase family A protein [Sphingobacterium sp.]
MAKVSVVIATYNRSGMLKTALDSLLAQSIKDWEAWVIDDGSTDDTEEIIQVYLDENPSFNYLKQTNQGVAAAKNKGVQQARGEYITFLDSDDQYKVNHLESRMKIIERYPEVDLLHGGVEIIGEEYVPDKYNDGRKIHLSECAIGATFFIRKKVFNLLGGFKKLPIGTDADFFERSKEAGLKILKTGLPTYIYNRSHRNSITHNYWEEMQNQKK